MIATDCVVFEALSVSGHSCAKFEKLLALEYLKVEYGRIYTRAAVFGELPEIAAKLLRNAHPGSDVAGLVRNRRYTHRGP
jgi:hypothetical protein